ncbi:glucose-6-phosphate isomerase [Deferribacter autotrophicus]|uniref:Glucose-6-phosphate isomerase n=1 Tax=Deferribacter autotrophicus TaxID=500465 RepID=A0A5A8F820_9BACT|nr:glucose-6-phosphate isomerase [Deferribacter autotrophicus]KAA0258178.1 glucose-6-phosphate isomerase [Deferribacter autotrophicus]
MHNIKVDINFAVKSSLKSGLDSIEIDEYKDKANIGYQKLLKLVDKGDIGFPKLVDQALDNITAYAKKKLGKFNDLVVVGIGGSSLGLEAIVNALLPHGYNSLTFSERGGFPRIWIADNVDPYKIQWIMKNCQPSDTLVCVISKSGGTVETVSNFNILYKWLSEEVEKPKDHIIVITDPEKGLLRKWSEENEIDTFFVPKNVGGRFSVFSPVGLVPASLLGLEIDKMIEGAKDFIATNLQQALVLSAIYIFYIEKGYKINVLMPYTSRLSKFADWYCQLWAESLGKRYDKDGKEIFFGTTPLKSVGAIDQHSLLQLFKEGPDDKVFTFIEVLNHDADKKIVSVMDEEVDYLKGKSLGELLNYELYATELALKNANRPSVKIVTDIIDEYRLGYLMMLFMYVVPIVGLYFNINPFDQPGVEEGKNYAYGLLGLRGFEDYIKKFEQGYLKLDEYII